MTLEEAKILVYGYMKDSFAYAEAVALMIAADSAMPNMTVGCHIDRGDPADHDFFADDLIIDNDWHDLNLSNIIPQDTKFVLIRCKLQTNLIGKKVYLRKKGNVNGINVAIASTGVSALPVYFDLWVACNGTDTPVQYKVNNVEWTSFVLTVRCWFK